MFNDKITKILDELSIEELSFSTGFIKNHNYKISGLAFVSAFFQMLVEKNNTLEKWASKIYRLTGIAVCAQSVQEKLQFRHTEFFKQLFIKSLTKQITLGQELLKDSPLLKTFKRVFLEDSTCVTMPKMLMDFFPGTINQMGASAVARIQLRLELKTANYTNIEIQSYRDNDSKFASDIIDAILPGDLIIRDLGYYNFKVFQMIKIMGAFFLSRFKYNTNVFDRQTKEAFHLAKHLNRLKNKGISIYEKEVLIGNECKFPVRLIALKVPPQIEQQRKRKMRKDRAKQYSKDYWILLAWTILITNVDAKRWTAAQALQVYGYRWRIEMVFKCWKNNFKLVELFKNKRSMSPSRAYISFFLFLTWFTLFFTRLFNFYLLLVYDKTQKVLSFFKFAEYLKVDFHRLNSPDDLLDELKFLAKYCTLTKRKAKSQLELIYMLNNT